jgi:hypothetical protein
VANALFLVQLEGQLSELKQLLSEDLLMVVAHAAQPGPALASPSLRSHLRPSVLYSRLTAVLDTVSERLGR